MSQREKSPTIIGSKELVDFPDLGLTNIPAKTDTGADSSSVWASNIQEKSGVLSFTLFDVGSPFYTGKIIETDDYKFASVRNSFGHAERRYKVGLRVVIAGRTIKGNFTLANRSNNKYPILLGRRTLNGRFIVDVSRPAGGVAVDMLVLGTHRAAPRTQQFFEGLQAKVDRLRVTYASYDELEFGFNGRTASVMLLRENRDIANFDVVYFKSIGQGEYIPAIAAAAAQYLQQRGVRIMDTVMNMYPGRSKLYQYGALQVAGLVAPPTRLVPSAELKKSFNRLADEFGTPFILKDISSNKGKNNFLVSNVNDFYAICAESEERGLRLITQQFVPNDGDYRVLVFGKKIALVIHRRRTSESTHLNNTSQGSRASIVPINTLPEAVQKRCIAAAKLLKREVAGVDVIKDKQTGLWYCLEVNDAPQLATGVFVSEKQAAFAKFIENVLRR